MSLRNAGCVPAARTQRPKSAPAGVLPPRGFGSNFCEGLDFPQAADSVDAVLIALDEAVERVRALSQALNPSPAAHVGLEGALANLAAGCAGAVSRDDRACLYRI